MNYDQLWQATIADTTADIHNVHGLEHWARVERNGVYIARANGADERVVRLFALFHDCMRLNDGSDPEHGLRAKEYILTIADRLTALDQPALDQLCYACEWHTHQHHHDDITIGTCWDADRLDLPRVGITPDAKYLNTSTAKYIARTQDFADLEAEDLRWLEY